MFPQTTISATIIIDMFLYINMSQTYVSSDNNISNHYHIHVSVYQYVANICFVRCNHNLILASSITSQSDPCLIHYISQSDPCLINCISQSDPCLIHYISQSDPCLIHYISQSDPCLIHYISQSDPCLIHYISQSDPCLIHYISSSLQQE